MLRTIFMAYITSIKTANNFERAVIEDFLKIKYGQMVLAVLLQHYRDLIFKCLRSTQLFRNEFIPTYLYIAYSIMLFLCYNKLGFKRS